MIMTPKPKRPKPPGRRRPGPPKPSPGPFNPPPPKRPGEPRKSPVKMMGRTTSLFPQYRRAFLSWCAVFLAATFLSGGNVFVAPEAPPKSKQGPPEKLYGTWVAKDVDAKVGEVTIKLSFREEGGHETRGVVGVDIRGQGQRKGKGLTKFVGTRSARKPFAAERRRSSGSRTSSWCCNSRTARSCAFVASRKLAENFRTRSSVRR